MQESTQSIESYLERIRYFQALTAEQRRELARSCRVVRMSSGECIFREGEIADGIFLVVTGRVRLVRTGVDGREQVLHEEGPWATLAEVPVFDGDGYVATAMTSEDSLLLKIPRAAVFKALESCPASAEAVIAVLAARVRKLAAVASDLSFKPIVERLAGFLLREHERSGLPSIVLPETRDQLGSHIGTVREQASRALSQLARAGVIEVSGRTAMIKNVRRLRVFAAGGVEPSGE